VGQTRVVQELRAYYRRVLTASRRRETPPPPPSSLLGRLQGLPTPPPPAPRPALAPGRLRIAIVSREYPPETGFGGMATYARELSRGLAAQGHRVTVIASGRPAHGVDEHGIEVTRIEPGLEGLPFERRLGAGFAFHQAVFGFGLAALAQLRRLERRAGERFDVVDLADHAAEGLIPALFAGRPSVVRLYTPASMLHDMRASLTERIHDDGLLVLEDALLRCADGIVGISRDLAARARTYFGLERPIPFVPNPLDTDLFRPAEPVGPTRGRGLRVVFVGRLETRKGVRTLFDALPRVLAEAPHLELRMIGADVEGFRAVAVREGLGSRVRFQDPVPLAELPRIYGAADLAVVPSHYDNSPYTCIEPMACGLAVVGTAAGGMPDYLEHGVSGRIVPSRDPAALASAILGLANDPEERRRLGAAARRRTVRDYDYRAVAETTVEHYREAIAHRSAGGGSVPRREVGPADARVPPRYAPALALSATRGEAWVVTREGEDGLLERTLASLRACAPTTAPGPTAVIREGRHPRAPTRGEQSFFCEPGDASAPARVAARIAATALADFLVPLRAGEVIDPVAMQLVAWVVAADDRVGVVTLPATSRGSPERRRAVFACAALRGPLLDDDDGTGWSGIGQRLYEATWRAGWREVRLPIPLLRGEAAADAPEVVPRAAAPGPDPPSPPVGALVVDGPPRGGWLARWPVASVTERLRAPPWIGAGLVPLERAQRAIARDPSLASRRPRPLIVAPDVASGVEAWQRWRAEGPAPGLGGALAVLDRTRDEGIGEPGLEVYPLGDALPRSRHAEAIARLAARHARVSIRWVGELGHGPLAATVRELSHAPRSPRSAAPGVASLPLPNGGADSVGIDSDGWARSHVRVFVTRPPGRPRLVVRGTIPLVSDPGFRCRLTLAIDGIDVLVRTLGPGGFELAVALPLEPALRCVELRGDRTQTLPAPDGRSVVARLEHVGFTSAAVPSLRSLLSRLRPARRGAPRIVAP
jgi:glycosyltransferase involved in cell wall biosynthesis